MNFINSKLPKVGTTIFSVMSGLANKHNAINLSQGFPNFDPPQKLIDLVTHHLNNQKNQYAPMPGVMDLRTEIAEKIDRLYGMKVNPESEITITAGATQALFTAITALISSGDEVLVFDPAYDSYIPAITLAGGIAITHTLKGPSFKIEWEQVKSLITARTRFIIINYPHNPTGTVLTEKDIQELNSIVSGRDIMVLSDEVYEHLVFDKNEHHSVLKYPELYAKSMAVFSFGKTFHSTGWKLGYIVAPQEITTEIRKVHQFNVFSVNTPIQYALADFMKDPEAFSELSATYKKKRDFFAERIASSSFELLPCDGTYFQLLDYSSISKIPDDEFARLLVKKHGIATIPVSAFYTEKPNQHLLRVCFAKTDDVLEQATEILCKI